MTNLIKTLYSKLENITIFIFNVVQLLLQQYLPITKAAQYSTSFIIETAMTEFVSFLFQNDL